MTKDSILREIKRTAALNGGIGLGWRKFAAETGIRECDWKGVHWTRWGDALREAGFMANELVQAYDATQLLEKYAELSLTLGHLPVVADLRMHVRNGSKFPDWHTFKKRFGGKRQLVEKLLEYCQERARYSDVARWCQLELARPGGTREQETSAHEGDIGYVYLVKHGSRCEYRIGRTNNPLRREGQISIALPETPRPVHVMMTDDPVGIEVYWHRRFESKRMRKGADWFKLDAADVAAFKRRKFM